MALRCRHSVPEKESGSKPALTSARWNSPEPISTRLTAQRCDISHGAGFDFAGLVDSIRVSFPLTNTFMASSLSPDSSVYS